MSGTKHTLVGVLILFFILFSFAPTFYEWRVRFKIHDDRHFELVHNFPTDYNLYLSRIREGKEGAWLATEKYTSEPHAGSLSQILYVLIGRLADYSHVQTPYVWFAYHAARAFFAGLLLVIIWKTVEWILNKASLHWQMLTFLLAVTASTWPKFEMVDGYPRFGGYMPWYTMADSLQRTTFMPHVTLAQGLLAFAVLVFSGGFVTRKLPGNWVFLGVVGMILGIVFPPGLLFLYGVLALVSAFELVFTKKHKTWFKEWFANDLYGRLVFGIMTLPTVVYWVLLFQDYPWKRLMEFDVLHPTKFSYTEYFLAVGPVLPLGVLAIIILFVTKQKEGIARLKYFIAWIVAWLGFMVMFNQIPQQSPTRFTQMAPHIPLAIVAGYVLVSWSRRFTQIAVVPVAIILLALGSMASSYMWIRDFVDHKLRATIPIVPSGAQVMYPMREIIDGLTWLQVYTPRNAIVLTGMTTGNYVPVYAGNTAFVGHANTVKLEEKLVAAEYFYRGRMSPADAKQWLSSNSIAYVFYGFEEREWGGAADLRTFYPDLEQVYETANVRIYRVK